MEDNMDGSALLIIALILYFVPAIVAALRQHPQRNAIIALNIFLGWTFIGWVVSLVWALTSIPEDRRRPPGPSLREPLRPVPELPPKEPVIPTKKPLGMSDFEWYKLRHPEEFVTTDPPATDEPPATPDAAPPARRDRWP
jgi:hypothetical protein